MKFDTKTWGALINEARLNSIKSTTDLLNNVVKCWLLDSEEFDKIQEIIYDARKDFQFNYIKAAQKADLFEELISFDRTDGSRKDVSMIGIFVDDTLIDMYGCPAEKMNVSEFQKAYEGIWGDTDISVELIDRKEIDDFRDDK